jgi:hypothetical protein
MNADAPALGGAHDRHGKLGGEKPADQQVGSPAVHALDDPILSEIAAQMHVPAEQTRETPLPRRVSATQHAKSDFVSVGKEQECRQRQAEKC